MSERNQRPSGETESINNDTHSKDQMESDSSMLNNHTEQSMLEDEEMPTYTSMSISSKHDNSNNNMKEQDSSLPGQGQRDCVLSSEQGSLDHDDKNEHTDCEDMNEMDLENDGKCNMNEDIDIKYQQDYSNRASDDCILNNRLEQHYKERSLSLQDLSNCEHNAHELCNKGRRSLNIFNHKYLNLQQGQTSSAALNKTRMIPRKYQHVQSKVKQYIRDIKEQNKKSKKKNTKGQDSIINKDCKKNEENKFEEVELPTTTIKDYAKKVIEDLQREGTENDKLSDGIIENGYWNTEDVEPNHMQNKRYNEKSENESKNVNMKIEHNDTEMVQTEEIENNNENCSSKIKNVKSIHLNLDELQNFYFKNRNADNRMKAEVTELKAELKRCNQETVKLKQELDVVKKSLAKYKDESRTNVQDEVIVVPTKNENTVDPKEMNNKASASSIGSVASSIDHWAESAVSLGISIKSPNVNSILNSDDSIVLTNYITPKKIINPLSRTFVTSSRILQTLSSIAQGKARIESPLARNSNKQLNENSLQNQSQDQSFHINGSSPIITSSSKKRKATETFPTFVQPFKIPHTSTGLEMKNIINESNEECGLSDEPKQEDLNVSTYIETEIKYPIEDKDRNESLLIQGAESIKDLESEKNHIQQYGPYLLSNLEVRMSEVNSRISIWGKEINYESKNDNEDDIKISEELSQKKICRWQDTSQTEFNRSPLLCSTNKKERIPPQYNRPNSSRYRNLSLNLVKSSSLENINKHKDSDRRISLSENCRSSQCQEKTHLCCIHNTETECKKQTDSAGTQENVYENHMSNSKSSLESINNHDSDTCSQNAPSNEEIPLIPSKQLNEMTKMKQRRLSGKKVRGILVDLFKGCGCSSENNNLNSRNMSYQKGSPCTVNDIPQIKISSPSKLICDTCTQGSNRCCRAHLWRLETQLEKIRAEMERMQSRLIAIVDMLHKLNSIDN